MSDATRQTVLFQDLLRKPVEVLFDGRLQSSDGGALLFGKLDRRVGLTRRLGRRLVDRRDPKKVQHEWTELLQQRIFQIALGYEDANDADSLKADPILKTMVGRRPVKDEALASQPTLSRFENAPAARELIGLANELESFVVERIQRRHPDARLITVDLDPTVDRTHGKQQLSLFNGHYDSHCYLPLLCFMTVDGDPEHYLFQARLRSGHASARRCAGPIIRRVVGELRRAFPRARIRIRLDGGYAAPGLFALLEELRVEYVVGMPKNKVLLSLIQSELEKIKLAADVLKETITCYTSFSYGARSWPRERRIVAKVEVTAYPGREPRNNPRFVVTNLRHGPERVYQIYCGRGDIENNIKELKQSLELDRTSCSRFLANQFRVLQVAAAYVLYQELRWELRGSELARAQVWRIRERLFKIGAWVTESVRRVVVHLPEVYPSKDLWEALAARLGAVPT